MRKRRITVLPREGWPFLVIFHYISPMDGVTSTDYLRTHSARDLHEGGLRRLKNSVFSKITDVVLHCTSDWLGIIVLEEYR